MDSRGGNIPLRSVPLIQRRDMTQLGGRTPAGVGAVVSRQRKHVSAYLDESTAGRVTPRSERLRASSREGRTVRREERRATGFALVEDEPRRLSRGGRTTYDPMASPQVERRYGDETFRREARMPRSGRAARADRLGRTDREDARRRTSEDHPYDSPRGLPGSRSRRDAVVGALCFVPEAVGSSVLSLMGHLRLGGVALMAAIALALASLYAPARELYLTNRKLDALDETYLALQEGNDAIRSELELLQTREGIENEARARGYVEPGETKVVVNGLPQTDATSAAAYDATASPKPGPWYVRVLDVVFGYEPEA